MPDNDVLYAHAASFVAFFESFVSKAKWDVNHYRVGFGSDTEGPEQVTVEKATTTTRPRALMNLAERLQQFKMVVINQIGAARWAELSDNTRIALLDFAYNYGELTPTLASAVKDGGPISRIIADVEAREGDNAGVNKARRIAEAALIATDETLT